MTPHGAPPRGQGDTRRDGIGIRTSVLAFAWLMEEALREHDGDRGDRGWQTDAPLALFRRLMQEADELRACLEALEAADTTPGRWHHGDPESFAALAHVGPVGKEAADVANFALMIADVCGALVSPEYRKLRRPPLQEQREDAKSAPEAESLSNRNEQDSAADVRNLRDAAMVLASAPLEMDVEAGERLASDCDNAADRMEEMERELARLHDEVAALSRLPTGEPKDHYDADAPRHRWEADECTGCGVHRVICEPVCAVTTSRALTTGEGVEPEEMEARLRLAEDAEFIRDHFLEGEGFPHPFIAIRRPGQPASCAVCGNWEPNPFHRTTEPSPTPSTSREEEARAPKA